MPSCICHLVLTLSYITRICFRFVQIFENAGDYIDEAAARLHWFQMQYYQTRPQRKCGIVYPAGRIYVDKMFRHTLN